MAQNDNIGPVAPEPSPSKVTRSLQNDVESFRKSIHPILIFELGNVGLIFAWWIQTVFYQIIWRERERER